MLSPIAILLSCLAVANGLLLAPLAARARAMTVQMGVSEAAAACLEEECSVDTVEDLIKELTKESNSIDMSLPLSPRQSAIVSTIAQLKALGANADKSVLSKIIDAASRSFSVVEGFDFPGEPLGFTGTPSKTSLNKA